MSPAPPVPMIGNVSFPRVSGDEPTLLSGLEVAALFSPRERG